ncbi:MAG: AraC family transcriptional regulator [Spirochaetales bacterium]|nr:AraC family transcriptional regulator [Spirochaetales bacterium]
MEKPPFIVRTCGFIDGPLRKPQNPHVHSTPGTKQGDYMVVLVTRGKGRYVNNRVDRPILAGEIGLFNPEDPGVLMSDRDDPYCHYYCRFTGTYARQMADEILHRQGHPVFRAPHRERLTEFFHNMGFVSNLRYRYDLPDKLGFREALLTQILVTLDREEEPGQSKNILTAESIADLLSEHMGDPTNIGEFATGLSVSRNTLMRKTREFFGMTVLQLHEELKMEWARQLLSLEMLNISETAHRLGYKDPLYFSRIFKKHYRVSPSEWKKLYKTGEAPDQINRETSCPITQPQEGVMDGLF